MSKDKKRFNIWSLLNEILKLMKSEVTTTAGKVNLASDIILAAVVASIFAVSAFERVAIAVVTIWNKEITEHLSSADSLIAFIILVVFFVACLGFLYISGKIKSRTK